MRTNKKWKLLIMAALSVFVIRGAPTVVRAETQHFNDGAVVKNLTSIQGNTVEMVAQWGDTTIILPDAKKPGYTFVAWYKDKECTEFVGYAGDPYVPTDPNETFYAKWTPNTYTLSFNPNLEHTETGKYALETPVGNMSDVEIVFDSKYGTLPTVTLDGYEFLGWYEAADGDKKVTATDRYTQLNADKTDGADKTLYAHWRNLNPENVKLHANNGENSYVVSSNEITTGWSKTPYTLYATMTDIGDGISTVKLNRNDAYSTANIKTNTYNKETVITEENGSLGTYQKEGTTSVQLVVNDTEGKKTGRIETGTVTTSKLNLKIDTKAPVVSAFTVSIGTHSNPNNTTTTLEWNDWKVYNSNAYGAKVHIAMNDKNTAAAGGEADVSKIKHAWITIFDTDNPVNTKDYELIADNSNVLEFSYDNIIDTNNDFKGVMNLTYELHVLDNAGNETIRTKTTERTPEVLSKVVKLTEDSYGDPLLFKAGYRGRLYIYTTGWVDTISLTWPEAIEMSGKYDTEHGELGMIYNATIITNGLTNDNPIATFAEGEGLSPEEQIKQLILSSEYTDYNNPSSKTITLDCDGEDTGFTRCYIFDFWVPVYIGHEMNPYHIDMNVITQFNTKITASKYIINTEAEAVTTETVSSYGSFDIRVGNGSILDEFHSSIVN